MIIDAALKYNAILLTADNRMKVMQFLKTYLQSFIYPILKEWPYILLSILAIIISLYVYGDIV